MQSNGGFTLIELIVVAGLITLISGIAVPSLLESVHRNSVWTASELIGSQIRNARLKAISHNKSYRVRFDCPAAGQFRILEVTGNATIDGALDRCDTYQTDDSGVFPMPPNVTYDVAPTLTVNSRGVFSSSDTIPQTIVVTYGGVSSRTLTVSLTGQITFATY